MFFAILRAGRGDESAFLSYAMLTSSIRLAALLAALSICAVAERTDAQELMPPTKRTTVELIQMLGSERFADREAASRELLLRDDALSALRESLPSLRPEAAR